MKPALEDDRMCFVCGPENPHGFRLEFSHPQAGLLRASVIFQKHHQGYKNIVHGGLVATLLDEMMVNLAWKENRPSVTAELTVRLKKPVPVGEKLLLEGRLDEPGERLARYSSTLRDTRGQILATATAKCLRIAGSLANDNLKE